MDGNYNKIKFPGHSSNLSPQISNGHCQSILMYFFSQLSLTHSETISYLLILLLDLHHSPHSPLITMILISLIKWKQSAEISCTFAIPHLPASLFLCSCMPTSNLFRWENFHCFYIRPISFHNHIYNHTFSHLPRWFNLFHDVIFMNRQSFKNHPLTHTFL